MGKETDDLTFFRDRVGFAIERDRLSRSMGKPPFNRFEERTVETHKAGDVIDAMTLIDREDEAASFLAGYARDLTDTHGLPPEEATDVAGENLRIGASKMFGSIRGQEAKAELWTSVLY